MYYSWKCKICGYPDNIEQGKPCFKCGASVNDKPIIAPAETVEEKR